MSDDALIIYTDGSCLQNPGPGGWGAVIIDNNGYEYVVKGHESGSTTNNRMELSAVIGGLDNIGDTKEVVIYSDSQYIVNAFNQKWLDNWQRKNWRKADGKPVLNQDLWQRLLALLKNRIYEFRWVKAHNKDHYNEMVDGIALSEANLAAGK